MANPDISRETEAKNRRNSPFETNGQPNQRPHRRHHPPVHHEPRQTNKRWISQRSMHEWNNSPHLKTLMTNMAKIRTKTEQNEYKRKIFGSDRLSWPQLLVNTERAKTNKTHDQRLQWWLPPMEAQGGDWESGNDERQTRKPNENWRERTQSKVLAPKSTDERSHAFASEQFFDESKWRKRWPCDQNPRWQIKKIKDSNDDQMI